jgi:hypothetical protein
MKNILEVFGVGHIQVDKFYGYWKIKNIFKLKSSNSFIEHK